MRVVVVGSGGREHSIIWKLNQDKNVRKIFCIGENYAISKVCETIKPINEDIDNLVKQIICLDPDLVVVGPEAPLNQGITDKLQKNNISVFGPTKNASKIESSKIFSKNLMIENNIPTSNAMSFENHSKSLQYANIKGYENIVIKADGLAAGKGVFIPESQYEMETVLEDLLVNKTLGKSGESLLIEDKIFGPEVSVFCFTDGVNYSDLIAICDYKRIFDNNIGPNTGGMGCYSPPEFWNNNLKEEIKKTIIEPTLLAMNKNMSPFKGMLYTGIMITQNGPKVIEYNCRFGDPECELIMPMMKNNVSEIFNEIASGSLKSQVAWEKKSSVCVVICSGGYPEKYNTGYKISGIDKLSERVTCFHSGTKEEKKQLVSNGGRVLVLTSLDTSIKKARENIYAEIDKIKFSNSFYRKDIALRAIE